MKAFDVAVKARWLVVVAFRRMELGCSSKYFKGLKTAFQRTLPQPPAKRSHSTSPTYIRKIYTTHTQSTVSSPKRLRAGEQHREQHREHCCENTASIVEKLQFFLLLTHSCSFLMVFISFICFNMSLCYIFYLVLYFEMFIVPNLLVRYWDQSFNFKVLRP